MYIIINKETDEFVGINMSNGGYPFETTRINEAKLWSSLQETAEYIAVIQWKNEDHPWVVKELATTFVDISKVKQKLIDKVWEARNSYVWQNHIN